MSETSIDIEQLRCSLAGTRLAGFAHLDAAFIEGGGMPWKAATPKISKLPPLPPGAPRD